MPALGNRVTGTPERIVIFRCSGEGGGLTKTEFGRQVTTTSGAVSFIAAARSGAGMEPQSKGVVIMLQK